VEDALTTLARINLDDLVGAFGWQSHPHLQSLARILFHAPARSFARQMLDFDTRTGEHGLAEAAGATAQQYVKELQVFGRERLPAGPVLAVANHPGVTDTLALFAALGRPDLKVIALDRPFLLALPNVSRYLVYLTDKPQARMSLVRQVAAHLRSGGAVLTFPAGHTEPDPDVYPGAVQSLGTWIDSASAFVRLAPGTAVVPVCVRGVTWSKAASHPLTRLRRSSDDQQLLAFALQLLANVMLRTRPVTARIQFGNPVRATERDVAHPSDLHRAILAEMRRLIESAPAVDGGGAF
jgi:1-acyl-sn-glycerol-3-phosphate acyltransferase